MTTTTAPQLTWHQFRRQAKINFEVREWTRIQIFVVFIFSFFPAYLPRSASVVFSILLICLSIVIALYRPYTGLLLLIATHPFIYLYKRLQYAQSGTLAEFNNPISLLPQILIICLLMRMLMDSFRKGRIRKPHILQFFVWAIIFMYTIGVLYSPSVMGGIFGMRSMIFPMMMFFIGRALIDTVHRLRMIVLIISILIMVATIYGLRQTFFGYHSFEYNWAVDFAGGNNISWFLFGGGQAYLRVFSILATPYEFATLTMLGVFILFLHFYPFNRRGDSIRFWMFAVAVAVGLFSTAIRGAWIGAIGGGILIFLIRGTRNSYQLIIKSTYRAILLAMVIPLVLSVAIIYAQGFGNALTERVESLANPLQARQMQSRYERWSIAFESAIEHPFGLGTGSTGFTGRRFGDENALEPDSQYIQALIEIGWVGLILVICFFAVSFSYFWNRYYSLRTPYAKHFSLIMIGVCVAFALRGFTMPVFAGQIATSWFWLLLGIGTNINRFESQLLEGLNQK